MIEPSGDLGGHRNGQYPAKSNNDQANLIAGAHSDKAGSPPWHLAALRKHRVSLPMCHKTCIPPGTTEIAL